MERPNLGGGGMGEMNTGLGLGLQNNWKQGNML